MYTGKDAANPAYPTQWALNPSAYQNVDSSQVDWAALAQQWIAMKEAAAIVAVPPVPSIKADEEGEAPMEVENPEISSDGPTSSSGEWNSNSWGNNWNQWGWNWSGSGPGDPKIPTDPALPMGPMIDGYTAPDGSTQMPDYTTGPVSGPTFQHGYWTAPQSEQPTSRSSSQSRERRSKSKNRDGKPPRTQRPRRDKLPTMPPVIEPIIMPSMIAAASTIDAAKRRQLPGWIREGLEKMEREKQKAIEREQEKKEREEAEKEQKRLEEEELERIKAEAGGQPVMPAKSKFDTDSDGEESDREPPAPTKTHKEVDNRRSSLKEEYEEKPTLVQKSKEEIMQEVMLAVRRSLTEILLEVTDHEIHTVSQEELARYNAAQASRLNAMKATKSKALAAIASGLGLGAYESSSDDSGNEDDPKDVSDQQLQDIIRRKRQEFERTSRDIEAEVKRAELRDNGDDANTPVSGTPEEPTQYRASTTPPPLDRDTPERLPERRLSKDKRGSHRTTDKVDGNNRRLDTILEEKPKRTNKNYTPSPQGKVKTNNKETSSSSDSDEDSSSSTSSSESEPVKVEKDPRKRKRRSSSEDSRKKSKKDKQKEKKVVKNSKSKYDDRDRSRSKRKEESRHKSSRDYDRHKDKYREESEDDRPRKRSKRSRSVSYESRRRSRDRSEDRLRRREKKSYDKESKRDRSYDKHDRYERRDYERRRSRSGSHRHRR